MWSMYENVIQWVLYRYTVYPVHVIRHSSMGVFQIGSSLLGKIIADFDWHDFVEN